MLHWMPWYYSRFPVCSDLLSTLFYADIYTDTQHSSNPWWYNHGVNHYFQPSLQLLSCLCHVNLVCEKNNWELIKSKIRTLSITVVMFEVLYKTWVCTGKPRNEAQILTSQYSKTPGLYMLAIHVVHYIKLHM